MDVYIRDIKRKKIMTSEEIKIARENKRQEDLKFIVKCVNDDKLSITEIRELKPEFSYNEVTPMIKELIEAELITQEQVEENRKNATRRTMNKDVELSPEEQVKFILNKVRKGYTPLEIVKSDKTKSLTMHKVLYQKRQLIAKGIISAEKAHIAMQKRQEIALARKHKSIIDIIREYTELGYTFSEISEFITDYNHQSLSDIKKEYIKENGWYTKEELKEFAVQRQVREAEEAEKFKREEQARLDRERREAEKLIKEAEKIRQAFFEKERKREIRSYAEIYKIYRKLAKKEDKLELDGEENVSTEGRKKFIEILIELQNLDAEISEKDTEIILNTIYMYPEFANKENIRFLISEANKRGGLKYVDRMIIELADTLRHTKFYEPLVEYRRWIRKQALLPKIQAMKKKGMNNTDIGKELGISSAEVSIIFSGTKSTDFADYADNGGR